MLVLQTLLLDRTFPLVQYRTFSGNWRDSQRIKTAFLPKQFFCVMAVTKRTVDGLKATADLRFTQWRDANENGRLIFPTKKFSCPKKTGEEEETWWVHKRSVKSGVKEKGHQELNTSEWKTKQPERTGRRRSAGELIESHHRRLEWLATKLRKLEQAKSRWKTESRN